MNKRSGSVLLLTLIISSIFIIFSFYVLTLVNLEYLTEVSVMRYEKMKLAAESGIDRGISILKKSQGKIPAYPDNIINYKAYNDSITCSVELGYLKDSSSLIGNYTVISKAISSDGKHIKKITALIEDTGSFKKDFYTDNIIYNPLTVISRIETSDDCPVIFKNNSSMNLYGTLYIQGSNIDLSGSNFGAYSRMLIKSNNLLVNNFAFEKDRVFTDIPEETYSSKDISYKNFISKLPMDKACSLAFNSEENAISETENKLTVFKTTSCNITDIDAQINTFLKTKPADRNNIDEQVWNNLSTAQKDNLTYYINLRDYTKLVFVNGDLSIDSGVYNNYLIFCSGTISVNNSATFNNSSLCCSKIVLHEGTALTIYPADKITLGCKINSIRDILTNTINGYYDNVEVKITGLIDS